jgi:hypothetical protein
MDASAATSEDRVDYVSVLNRRQQPTVDLVRDLYGGTETMRAAGEKYLPKHPAEEDQDYRRRLARAKLFNAVRRTAQAYVGMVFRRMPVLGEGVTPDFEVAAENIDLQGRALGVFARDVFLHAILDGHTFIYVDAPQVNDPRQVEGSLADVRRSGRRPFWRHILKQDVINAQWDFEEGRPVLNRVVIRESETERLGTYGEREVDRYRELVPGEVLVWRREGRGFQLESRSPTSINFVPLVPVYTNRTGFLESEPPLVDLAHENVEHWQVRSDHRYALGFASVPLPCFIGQKKKDIEWGANRAIFLPNPEAKAQILESSGAGLAHSRQELQDIKQNMSALGLANLVRDRSVQKTAEEDRNERAESHSNLQAMALGLRDALEESMLVHARYTTPSATTGGSIEVNKDFETLAMSPQWGRVLLDMVTTGKLREETMWQALIAGEVLPETFDPEVERALLESGGFDDLTDLPPREPEPEPEGEVEEAA